MIHNKNIRVDNVESKMASTGNTKYILTMDRDKFYFWRLENGSEGDVYQSFISMSNAGLIKKGLVVAIGYTEEDESFINKEGKTINYKARHIVGLKEAGNGTVESASAPAEKPSSGQNFASGGESREAFGQRLAIHGMVNGMLANGKSPAEVKGVLGELFKLEDAIDHALKNLSDVLDDLPVIEQDQQMDVSDIPF